MTWLIQIIADLQHADRVEAILDDLYLQTVRWCEENSADPPVQFDVYFESRAEAEKQLEFFISGELGAMGDAVQMDKAGILEIADAFVINKADFAGESKLKRELLDIAGGRSIHETIATQGQGVVELLDALT